MNTNKETLRLYWQQIRKYKPSFFTMLVTIPSAALLLDTLLPYFLSQAVGALAAGNADRLPQYLTIAAGIGIAGVALNLLGFQTAIRHEIRVRRDLINNTLERLLVKDQDFFANQKIGALTGKFIDFVSAHVGLQDLFIIRTLNFALSIGSGIAIIFWHTPLLGGIILALIIILLAQIRLSVRLRRPYRKARKDLIGEVNGALADTISNNLTVKTFAQEKYEQSVVNDLSEKYRDAYVRDFRWMSVEGSLRLAVMATVQIIAIAVMAQLLVTNKIELGIAIFAIAYLQRIASQLFSLGDIINGYDKLFLQASPMTEILLEDHAVKDKSDAPALRVAKGEIAFQNVSYAYDDAHDANVIESLDITIPAGQKVGLVGHSGAGKTTLTRLILRFADVNHGSIMIDSQNISDVSQESLRHAIAYVPQEPLLFHRSLRENIIYGKLDATDDEVRDAARKANALEFIEALPQGFDTIVGERGIKLSGGQRQRIAIARAILKDAPILVLDEATSALDSQSERLIQDALAELMKDRTSIVIAHRLSTIAKLDRIIVLENGHVIEDGSHKKLINQSGVYASLWAHQSGGFIDT